MGQRRAHIARAVEPSVGRLQVASSSAISLVQIDMVKHIVFWRLKEYAHGNDKTTNARVIKQKLEQLNGKIPGLLALEVGIDFSATESSSDIVLYSEFTNREALAAYQAHPEHQAVMSFVGEAREERRMVDYEA